MANIPTVVTVVPTVPATATANPSVTVTARGDGDARTSERDFADKRRERRADKAAPPRNKLEERYSPSFKPGRPGAGRTFTSSRPLDADKPAANSENPLALRRNEQALKMLANKQPSLPAIRKRRNRDGQED